MRQLIMLLVAFITTAITSTALASNIDEYFYHEDGLNIDHRKATLRVVNAPWPPLPADVGDEDLIVAMYWTLFCHDSASETDCPRLPGYKNVQASIDANIHYALTSIQNSGKDDQVRGWHIIDEPYLDTDERRIPRSDIEYAISRVYWISKSAAYNYSGDLPFWVNFAHDCFYCSTAKSSVCMPNSVDYCGTPGNASWVSFDWYAADTQPKNCGNGKADCNIDTHVSNFVTPTLTKLKAQRWHYQDILLYPGTYTGGADAISATGANEVLARYLDIAKSDSSVIGVVPFTYITPSGVSWKGVSTMPNGEQAEMFYQGIAVDSVNGLADASWKPVFEYNDDPEYSRSGAISPAETHFYTIGYQGAETGLYTIRRLAFYMKASSGGIYTRKIYRCRVARPAGRFTVYFTPNSNCDGALGAVQDGTGYVSPNSTGEADHLIVNCRRIAGPYWDQAWALVGSGQNASTECINMFGSDYVYFTNIGYSKKF